MYWHKTASWCGYIHTRVGSLLPNIPIRQHPPSGVIPRLNFAAYVAVVFASRVHVCAFERGVWRRGVCSVERRVQIGKEVEHNSITTSHADQQCHTTHN
jgi:hypothetical protein